MFHFVTLSKQVRKSSIKNSLLTPILLLGLAACGGSSGGSDIVADQLTSDIEDILGGDIIDATSGGSETGGDVQSVITPISDLGPMRSRLYAGTPYGELLTGPVVGGSAGSFTNAEIINEIPFEVVEGVPEIVIEAAYLLRRYPLTGGDIQLDEADPVIVFVTTNVSNVLMCDIEFRGEEFEFINGASIGARVNILGFVTIEDQRFNFVNDRFQNDCIPPGLSAFAMGDSSDLFLRQFHEQGIDGAIVDVEDVARIRIDEIRAQFDDNDVVDTNGLHAISYTLADNAGASVLPTIVNPSDRTLDGEGMVILIDPDTGLPIGAADDGSIDLDLSDGMGNLFEPGDEQTGLRSYHFGHANALGSTNTIFFYPEYFDVNSR